MHTWPYRYRDHADRQDMIERVRELAADGRKVALGVRHPPGAILIHGDKDDIFQAQIARPIPPLNSKASRR